MSTNNKTIFYVDPSIFLEGLHPDDVVATFCGKVGQDTYETLEEYRVGAGKDLAHSWYVQDMLARTIDGEFPAANDEQEELLSHLDAGDYIDLSMPGSEGQEDSPLLRKATPEERDAELGGYWAISLGIDGEPAFFSTVKAANKWIVEQKRISVPE